METRQRGRCDADRRPTGRPDQNSVFGLELQDKTCRMSVFALCGVKVDAQERVSFPVYAL